MHSHPSPPAPSIYSCDWHPTHRAEVYCDQCHRSCCESCHVQIEGEDWCVDCSLVAAGVRTRTRASRRHLRRLARNRRRLIRAPRAVA